MLMVDYIRLTTTDRYAMKCFNSYYDGMLGDSGGKDKVVKVMQYTGVQQLTGLFLGGCVDNQGRDAMMVQQAGCEAHTVYGSLHKLPVRVTRVDIQVTVPGDSETYKFFDMLCEHRFQGFRDSTGKALQWVFIEGSNGLDTLYVGSRKSDYYRRIYVKEINQERYIRFELELKGQTARSIQPGMFNNGMMLGLYSKAFRFLSDSGLPEVFDWLMSKATSEVTMTLPDKPVKQTLNKEWVETIVLPYLVKAIEIDREYMRSIVNQLNSQLEFGNRTSLETYNDLGEDGIRKEREVYREEIEKILWDRRQV